MTIEQLDKGFMSFLQSAIDNESLPEPLRLFATNQKKNAMKRARKKRNKK